MATSPPHLPLARHRGRLPGGVAVIASVVLLIVVIAIGVGGGVAYWLWSSEPTYWQTNEQFKAAVPHEQRKTMAVGVERRVMSTLSRVSRPPFALGHTPSGSADSPASAGAAVPAISPDDPDIRVIELTYQEVNAWLAERLDDLLANQGQSMPTALSDPMVAAEGGHLVAAFRYTTPRLEQIISLVLGLELQLDGKARVEVIAIRGGQLPLPTEELANRLRSVAPSKAGDDQIDQLVRGIEGAAFDPIIKLDPTRQARLIGYVIRSDGATLTFHLEPRKD